MGKKHISKLVFIALAVIMFFTSSVFVYVQAETKDDLQNKIQEYEQKLKDAQQQKNTLSSQITYMDTQMELAELRITETEKKVETVEKEINVLGSRIEGLDTSLDNLSTSLIERISEGYKNRTVNIFDIVLDSQNAGDLMNKYKYYSATQANNQRVLLQVQETKLNFEEQKHLRERKKEELDNLKATLDNQKSSLQNQKAAKQKLLAVTKNDESTYQSLLERARAELAAIRTITTTGAANESSSGEVTKGTVIASVISGTSCNSGGTHLHFMIKNGGSTVNPFSYLKSGVGFNNCSGSSCGSGDGDAFNPSGNLDWPLSPSITMTQGYGKTWAVSNTWVGNIYGFHDGIDMTGASSSVYAVADGTVYKGGFKGANGCTLPYVKLVHKESGLVSYYLHVYAN